MIFQTKVGRSLCGYKIFYSLTMMKGKNGNLPTSLQQQQQKKVRKYKITLRKIANRNESLRRRKKLSCRNILIPAANSAINAMIHGEQ